MVIDDNSPDGTADAVTALQSSYPSLLLYKREKKEGLGRAYTAAMKKVLEENIFDVVCTMDADHSHDPEYLPGMLHLLEDADFVIGSRYVEGGSVAGWEFSRKMLSAFGNFYCRLVTRLPIHDCTSGFGCIRTSLLQKIDLDNLDASGYAFLMALKYNIWKKGARIKEFPICFKSRLSGESKISLKIIEEGIFLPWKMIKTQRNPAIECPICRKKTAHLWFTKNGHDIYQCKNCNLIFVFPLPKDTGEIYSEDYFCGAESGFGYINYDADKDVKAASFERFLDLIENHTSQKGNILDIGAATGMFLEFAKEKGWTPFGVEISPYAAEVGRKKGLEVKTGTLDNNQFENNFFSVITLWDVFEHVPYPHQTLEQIKQILQPNGLVIFNMPDAGSFMAKLLKKMWPLILPPEHLHLFNEKNFTLLLKEHGFIIEQLTKIGKKYKPSYILHVLSTVSGLGFMRKISEWIKKTPLDKVSIPLHMRDNMCIVARYQDHTSKS